jgi:hypothetical protein
MTMLLHLLRRRSVVLVGCLFLATEPAGLAGDIDAVPQLKAHAEVQEALHAMARPGATDLPARLEALKGFAGDDPAGLVQQLLLFSLHAQDTRAAMLPGAVIKALDLSAADLAAGLVPVLEDRDEKVRAKVRNWLGQVEIKDDGAGRGLDFSTYRAYLQARAGQGCDSLVRYMWSRDQAETRKALAAALGQAKAEGTLRRLSLSQPAP